MPEVREADDRREGEDEERHPTERDEELHLELLAEGAVREERLDDRHRAAEGERGEEEVEREERRVPERVELRRDDQVEGPERGLVERREEDAEDDEERHDDVEDVQRLRHLEALEDDRAELEREDRRVERDAPADLEHDRVRVPHDERVPDVPGAPEVEHERDDDEAVAEERRQDGRADDRPELLEVEDVDRRADREAAGGEGDAAEDVEADPEPPGEGVGEVRGAGEALEEADDGGVGPEGEDDEEDSPPEREARALRASAWRSLQCSFGDLVVRTLGRLDLVAAVADPVDAAEEDGAGHDDVGDDVQDPPGQERRAPSRRGRRGSRAPRPSPSEIRRTDVPPTSSTP